MNKSNANPEKPLRLTCCCMARFKRPHVSRVKIRSKGESLIT